VCVCVCVCRQPVLAAAIPDLAFASVYIYTCRPM